MSDITHDMYDLANTLPDPDAELVREAGDEIDRVRRERDEVRKHLSGTVWEVAELLGAKQDCPGCQKAVRKRDERVEPGWVCARHMSPHRELLSEWYREQRARADKAEARATRLDGLLLALTEAGSDMQRDHILSEYRRISAGEGMGNDGA